MTNAALQSFGDNIWTVRTPLVLSRMDVSTQMTVVRLPDNALVLMSPVAISTELKQQLDELGHVKYVISPNQFHHMFVQDCLRNFPDAEYYAPPGLNERVQGLPNAQDLHAIGDELYQGQLQSVRYCDKYMPDERLFFHPASGSLIATDLLMNFSGTLNFATRVFTTVMGLNRGLAMPRIHRFMTKDKQQARRSVQEILAWDIKQILLPHNSNVTEQAKQKLEHAFSPIL